jgi:probable HAF family extracellular repeat protein
MTSLGTLGAGTWSAAYGIDANNQVAGSSDTGSGSTHAVRWNSGGGINDLGTLGGMNSYGMAINNSGSVTGFAANHSGYLRAFLYAAGYMTELGTLGGTSSYAFGINSSSTIVGYADVVGLDQSHAFIWSNGAMTDLNTLIGGSAWELNQAYAINDNGQIVGIGTRDGLTHAFRLDPIVSTSIAASIISAVPEPGTISMGAGLAAILGFYCRLRYRR